MTGQNIQVVVLGDWKFRIHMRGQVFDLEMDPERNTWKLLHGELPSDVKKDPEGFIKWLFKKLPNEVDSSGYKRIH